MFLVLTVGKQRKAWDGYLVRSIEFLGFHGWFSRGRFFCVCPLVPGSDNRETGGQTRKDRPFVRSRKRGRPAAAVKNDLTIARIHHMRFMNVPVETIAKEIGVSRRTFYRRWNQIAQLNLDPETPFSKWI